MSRIPMSLCVRPNPVHPNAVGHVLYGPGLQQTVPGPDPGSGPVGHIDQGIIALHISGPYRKPKVITDQGAEPKTPVLHKGLLAPRPIGPIFPGDRKSTRLNSSHVKISYAV